MPSALLPGGTPCAAAAGALTARPRRALPPVAALVLHASIIVSMLAASSAPTPLYAVYQAEWGFTAITTTVVFGVYALAVLAALLVVGRLSDHVGRRPVLVAALTAQAVAMLVLTTAAGVPELLVGRVAQGLATGAAVGALGAAMLDLDRRRGTVANTVSPPIGTAVGALVSGLVVQFLPAPTHLVFLLLLAVFALQALGVLATAETVSRRPGALGSLTPEIGLPRGLRGPVLVAVPVLFASWSLAGFYGALAPALLRGMTGSASVVLAGAGLAVLAGVAATATWLLRAAPALPVMWLGTLALVAGMGLVLGALAAGSVTLFFIGTLVAGIGFGSGFQGGIRTVVPLAEPHERSGVLSLLFVVSYLGMGVPAVIAGVVVVHGGGLLPTARGFAGVVVLLSLAALAGLLRQRRRRVA